MEPPAITRHRRPFLAPLWLTMLAAVAVGAIALGFYLSATTTVVFLVRPVEKDPGTIDDPPVSPEGEERAQRLAHMFGGVRGAGSIDAYYESDERRAQQTAAPLMQQLHRAPVVFRAADARLVAGRALHEHRGGSVLIIASGSVLSQVGQELTGADLPPASADEPDLVYVVSVPSFGHAQVVRFRF